MTYQEAKNLILEYRNNYPKKLKVIPPNSVIYPIWEFQLLKDLRIISQYGVIRPAKLVEYQKHKKDVFKEFRKAEQLMPTN